MRFLSPILAAIAALFVLAPAASAQSFLDEYLNNMRLDQATPPRPKDAARLAQQKLVAGHVFGQTFITGPGVTEIRQISIDVPLANPEWGEGTSLVMSLYDGPEKGKKFAEFEMKYEWREWEDMKMAFPFSVPAEPGHTYYFELEPRGGDGRIGAVLTASADYPGGRAYIDGKPQDFDFVFVTAVGVKWDRDQSYAQQFAKINLELPGLAKVKEAVAARNWDTAAKELVAHFESRGDLLDLVPVPAGGRKPEWDREAAELAANMSVKDAGGKIVSLGPNWNHSRWWDTRGGVGLTREGIRKHLAAGYVGTGDEKYAIAWTNLLKAVFTDLPSPIKAGVIPPDAKDISPVPAGGIEGGSMWAGLSTAARIRHGFWYYKSFAKSPNFPWDVRAAFIMNMVDMAEVLAVQKGGGNWADQMNVGLFDFGTGFPEFARAKELAQKGFDGLVSNMRDTLLPDGSIGESGGYQFLVLNTYLGAIHDAKAAGLDVPADVYARMRRALRFHLLSVLPDGNRPCFGDALAADMRPLLRKGYDELGGQGLLWQASDGEDGAQPVETSVEFPYSNYYVMRSAWTPDALYLCLKNGRYTAHGHFDSLGFVIHALGNPMIVDPGVYIYGTKDTIRIQSTPSHSTVCVDGANLANGGGPNQFFAGRSADYLNARGPEYQGLPRSIFTERRVVFIKPDYWVFSDVVRGSGEHRVDSRFHFANTKAVLDQSTQTAVTTYEQGGNMAIIPVAAGSISSAMENADTAFVHEKLEPALILKQSAKRTLPIRLDNVLYPFAGASADAKVSSLAVTRGAGPGVSGVRVDTSRGTDLVVFTDSAMGSASFADGVTAKAQSATIRLDNSSKTKSFSWLWGARLSHGKQVLAESRQPVSGLDVVYEADTVYVTAKDPDQSLRIAAFGASKVATNGGDPRPVVAQDGMLAPFAQLPPNASVIVDNEARGFAMERQIKGSSVGGDDQIGFNYYWGHVSPGRNSLMTYTPSLPRATGLYEVSVFVPTFRLFECTKDARYAVTFRAGGKFALPVDRRARVLSCDAASGRMELSVDQAAARGTWVSLGCYELGQGTASRVEISGNSSEAGSVVLADAVRWTRAQ